MDYVWKKGNIIERRNADVSFEDRGYYFGDGVYEVVRLYNGVCFQLEEHYTRFVRSTEEIDIPIPFTLIQFKEMIDSLSKENNISEGYVYIQITRGEQERNHLYERGLEPVVTAFAKEAPIPVEKQKNGISLYALEDIRWLRCDIKTINLLGNVMAKRKAEDNACDEALQHRGTVVTEGSSTNIFIVKDGAVITHPANELILNGITRLFIQQLAKQHNISFLEKTFSVEEASHADEMFISSTTMEITPVVRIEGSFQADYSIGPVTKRLQEAFSAAVRPAEESPLK